MWGSQRSASSGSCGCVPKRVGQVLRGRVAVQLDGHFHRLLQPTDLSRRVAFRVAVVPVGVRQKRFDHLCERDRLRLPRLRVADRSGGGTVLRVRRRSACTPSSTPRCRTDRGRRPYPQPECEPARFSCASDRMEVPCVVCPLRRPSFVVTYPETNRWDGD
jgi:hypothetical protein